MEPKPYWNPYLAGIALGLVVLASFFVTGRGIGASGAAKRASAVVLHEADPTWAEEHAGIGKYFADPQRSPLNSWIVWLALGVVVGGGIGSLTARRFRLEVVHGPRVAREVRLALAFASLRLRSARFRSFSAWERADSVFARACSTFAKASGSTRPAA